MPITRRDFCKTIALSSVSSLLSACTFTQLGSQVAALGVPRPFVVWTHQNSIDAPIARWRRLNPQIAVNRIALAPADIDTRVSAALAGHEAFPDAIVADSATLGALQRPGVFRQLPEFAQYQKDMASVGIKQCSDPSGQLFALPLTVNPYGLWYRSDLLHNAGQVSRPDTVTTAIGNTWEAFLVFCDSVAAYMPALSLIASAIDDVFVPRYYQAQSNITTDPSVHAEYHDAVTTATQFHARGYTADAPRMGGKWFDLLQRDQIAMVIGGSWLQSALERTVRPDEFPWRLISPPGGWIAGPGLAIAIPEQGMHVDTAWQFGLALAHDAELQLSLSDATTTIPALLSTYPDGRFQRSEPFTAGQHIGQLWTNAATQLYSHAMTPQRSAIYHAVQSMLPTALTNQTPPTEILSQIDKLSLASQ